MDQVHFVIGNKLGAELALYCQESIKDFATRLDRKWARDVFARQVKGYAEALLVATPASALVDGKRPRRMGGVTPDQMAKMEREMSNLQGQYRLVEQSYGQDVLNLVLARGYLAKLLENAKVARYLAQLQSEVLEQFKAIVEAVALDQ